MLFGMAGKQPAQMVTDQMKTLCSCHDDTFEQAVKRKIAILLSWAEGMQFNYGEGGGLEDIPKWLSRRKNEMMSFFTGTITEMK